jgi:hypothetical protein
MHTINWFSGNASVKFTIAELTMRCCEGWVVNYGAEPPGICANELADFFA